MSRGNRKSFRQQSAEGPPVEPPRPPRVVREHGSLTFDSYLCCEHSFASLESFKGDGPDLLTHGQRPEFEVVCVACGAGATYGDVAGRRMIVAYDRDWNYGIPPKPERHEPRQAPAQKPVEVVDNSPVTWEDGLS